MPEDRNLNLVYLEAQLEALLFVSGEAVSVTKLMQCMEIDEHILTKVALNLQEHLNRAERGLSLIKIANSYRLCTKTSLANVIEKLIIVNEKKLSEPLLETLSIVAFKQPVTKQEIEDIRGVSSEKIIKRLLERKLIQEIGRKKVIGRPILYGTTTLFLQSFGLQDLQDLPELIEDSANEQMDLFQEFADIGEYEHIEEGVNSNE